MWVNPPPQFLTMLVSPEGKSQHGSWFPSERESDGMGARRHPNPKLPSGTRHLYYTLLTKGESLSQPHARGVDYVSKYEEVGSLGTLLEASYHSWFATRSDTLGKVLQETKSNHIYPFARRNHRKCGFASPADCHFRRRIHSWRP